MEPPWEWPSPGDGGEHATAPNSENPKDPVSPISFPHCESIFKGVSQKWSGLSGAIIHSSRPGRPLPPGQTLSTLTAFITTEMGEVGEGELGRRLIPVNTPTLHGPGCQHHPPTPYPGLHQLRPLARLGQEWHTGARGTFPRLGLRGEWSRPRGQSWWGERLPAPNPGGGGGGNRCQLPMSPECRCYRECQGSSGRREVCPGKVGEEPWTGHWEQQEAWDRGHQLPVSLTCCGTPGHVPLWALLLSL